MVAPLGFDVVLLEAHGVPDVYAGDDIQDGSAHDTLREVQRESVCDTSPAIVSECNNRRSRGKERVNEVDDILSPFTLRMSEGVVLWADRFGAESVSSVIINIYQFD